MLKLLLYLKRLIAEAQIYLRILVFRKYYKGISRTKFPYFYKNLLLANKLRENGVSFEVEDNYLVARFLANGHTIRLIIHSANDLGLIDLVFVHRNYNFIPTHPVDVIDIGMNIGDTSLFFASNPFTHKVYGYELCEPTYKVALKNFSINPEFRSKIQPHCYGLGTKTEKVEIIFHNDYLGANGVFEVAGKHLFRSRGEKLICEVRNVADEIMQINTTLPLLLKVDVEGNEYDIIRELDRRQILSNIQFLMLEYHFGIQDLIEILLRNGFAVHEIFSSKNEYINLGMIYASKYCSQ